MLTAFIVAWLALSVAAGGILIACCIVGARADRRFEEALAAEERREATSSRGDRPALLRSESPALAPLPQ